MLEFWEQAQDTKLLQNWSGGVAEGLLTKHGLYDNRALKDFLSEQF
jgi:hypothetical protein